MKRHWVARKDPDMRNACEELGRWQRNPLNPLVFLGKHETPYQKNSDLVTKCTDTKFSYG